MKAIANKEIFVIIVTVGTLLLGNGYMAATKQYQDFYRAAVTEAPAVVYPSCQ